MKWLLTGILLSFLFSVSAQNKDEQSIRSILKSQTIEWNKGNIDAFMEGYWKNDSLMFIGQSGVTYGYNNTLKNYKKNYPDDATMGKLNFNIIKVQPLSSDTYFVLGKWMLSRSIGNISGHYTLIFRKINQQWVIVSDHSS